MALFRLMVTLYGRPFVSKLVMTTLCKKWVASRDKFIHRVINLIHRAITAIHQGMNYTHRVINFIHSAMNSTHRVITALLHANQRRITAVTSRDNCNTPRDELHTSCDKFHTPCDKLHASRDNFIVSSHDDNGVVSHDVLLHRAQFLILAYVLCACAMPVHCRKVGLVVMLLIPLRIWVNRHRGLKAKHWRLKGDQCVVFFCIC